VNSNPTAKQKRWHQWLRDSGCAICHNPTAIHHIAGSKMKLKGVKKPGEWFCVPLCYNHHQGDDGIHANKRAFEKKHGTEKELFKCMVEIYGINHEDKPMSEADYQAIMDRA